jgi:hypothetical protein
MLQTSPPTARAVEQSMMPQDKYTKALDTLKAFSEQAAKVRNDAEVSLTNKKATIRAAEDWLRGTHDKLVGWLEGQHKHLKTILKQAKEYVTRPLPPFPFIAPRVVSCSRRRTRCHSLFPCVFCCAVQRGC